MKNVVFLMGVWCFLYGVNGYGGYLFYLSCWWVWCCWCWVNNFVSLVWVMWCFCVWLGNWQCFGIWVQWLVVVEFYIVVCGIVQVVVVVDWIGFVVWCLDQVVGGFGVVCQIVYCGVVGEGEVEMIVIVVGQVVWLVVGYDDEDEVLFLVGFGYLDDL